MTKREKVIVTAYTGILMADLEDVYAYAKECEKKKHSRTRRFTKLTFKGLSIPLFLLLKFII